MNEYVTLVTTALDDDSALIEALAAHQRRRPRDGTARTFDPSRWTVYAVRTRTYRVDTLTGWQRRLAGLEASALDLRYPRRRAADVRARETPRD